MQELRDEIRSLKAPQPTAEAPQPTVPDIFEDPEGFVAYQNQQLQAATLNTTLNVSETLTRQAVGDDAVNEAQEWGKAQFAQNPALYQSFLQQRNPYGFLVEQYKKASVFAKLGDDPSEIEAYLAWKQAKEAPQPAPAPVPVPDTLADAQSARGSTAEPYRVPSLDEILKR